jgi:hypothetical protein
MGDSDAHDECSKSRIFFARLAPLIWWDVSAGRPV